MAILKYKEIKAMSKASKEEKIKELKIELLKASANNKKSNINPKEIKKTIARILTSEINEKPIGKGARKS